MRLALFVPGASSGGATALHRHFSEAWESLGSDFEIVQIEDRAPSGGRALLRPAPIDAEELRGASAVLCPGNRVVSSSVPVLWWPLTVAPLERPTKREMSVTPAARLRFAGMTELLRLSSRACDALVFSSCYARGLYTGRFPKLGELPSTVVHPSPTVRPTGTQQEIEGLPDRYVLSVSTLNRYKRVIEIVKGFAAADLPGSPSLVFAGHFPDSEYETEARRVISELGIEERVEFVGYRSEPELRFLYTGAAAFVFASISENASSYALIDALAHGLPVASSDRSSMPEIGGTAVTTLDPDDPASISRALERAMDPSLAEGFRSASLDRAGGLPTWQESARRIHHLAESVLGQLHQRQPSPPPTRR